jgi:hypothetical protein
VQYVGKEQYKSDIYRPISDSFIIAVEPLERQDRTINIWLTVELYSFYARLEWSKTYIRHNTYKSDFQATVQREGGILNCMEK